MASGSAILDRPRGGHRLNKTVEAVMVVKKLLFCWVAQNLNVLVPKKRGEGFLQVPYGHHYNMALTDIADSASVDVTGLDGALTFECGGKVFHGGADARKAFAAKVIPKLENHYGFVAQEIDESQFWALNPLAARFK